VQEQGLLTLDDPVNKYLPFKVVNPAFPGSAGLRFGTHINLISGNLTNDLYLSKTIGYLTLNTSPEIAMTRRRRC
jgi:hypothetical protein